MFPQRLESQTCAGQYPAANQYTCYTLAAGSRRVHLLSGGPAGTAPALRRLLHTIIDRCVAATQLR